MFMYLIKGLLGRVAQLVTCLAAETCLSVDPGVASWIPARSHTFGKIDHEIISMDTSFYSRRVVVNYKRKLHIMWMNYSTG